MSSTVLNKGKRILSFFLRKRISPEQIIQRNWSYKIQVFKIAAKAEKDKTQKQSQRMKNNLNKCVLAF